MGRPDNYQMLVDVPEGRKRVIDMTGAGASVPTKNYGAAGTITRVGAGQYRFTFSERPGNFVGYDGAPALRSATGTDIKNYSAVYGNYNTTTLAIDVFIFNSAGTATDLTTAQSVTLAPMFALTSVKG